MKTYEVIVDTIYREVWHVEAADAEAAEAIYFDEGTFIDTDPCSVIDPDPHVVRVREAPEGTRRAEAALAEERLRGAAEALLKALEYFFNIPHALPSSIEKGYIRQAQDMARAALAKARGEG